MILMLAGTGGSGFDSRIVPLRGAFLKTDVLAHSEPYAKNISDLNQSLLPSPAFVLSITFKDIFHVNPCVQRHEYYHLNYILNISGLFIAHYISAIHISS